MNFLAHSLFAQGNSERIAGQFAGDFVRGSELSGFSADMQLGIRMHRFIDHFTDHHPDAVAVREVFEPPVRRFAGIVTDVLFDHYLARDWETYASIPLRDHVSDVHAALNEHHEKLPPGLQRFSAFIQRENVLEGNLHPESVLLTLQRISRRSPRFAPMVEGAKVAQDNEGELLQVFNRFFPDLIEAAHEHRKTLR